MTYFLRKHATASDQARRQRLRDEYEIAKILRAGTQIKCAYTRKIADMHWRDLVSSALIYNWEGKP